MRLKASQHPHNWTLSIANFELFDAVNDLFRAFKAANKVVVILAEDVVAHIDGIFPGLLAIVPPEYCVSLEMALSGRLVDSRSDSLRVFHALLPIFQVAFGGHLGEHSGNSRL
jgi:hypothetical protein